MVPKPVTLGPHEFKTTGAATSFVKSKLSLLPFGIIDTKENQWLLALVKRHPDPKKSTYVCGFSKLRTGDGNYDYGFAVVRPDGFKELFNYKKCISGKDFSSETKMDAVLRLAIREQLLACKRAAFAGNDFITCPVSEELIGWNGCDADHDYSIVLQDGLGLTFKELKFRYNEFLKLSGTSLNKIPLRSVNKGSDFERDKDKKAWQKWHAENAKLRAISKKENTKNNMVGKKRLEEYLKRMSSTIDVIHID